MTGNSRRILSWVALGGSILRIFANPAWTHPWLIVVPGTVLLRPALIVVVVLVSIVTGHDPN